MHSALYVQLGWISLIYVSLSYSDVLYTQASDTVSHGLKNYNFVLYRFYESTWMYTFISFFI